MSMTISQFVKGAADSGDNLLHGVFPVHKHPIHKHHEKEHGSLGIGTISDVARFAQCIKGDSLIFYQKNVARLIGRQSTQFPGSQPITFTRTNLEQMSFDDFLMCEKTDGIRYLLYLATDHNSNSNLSGSQILIDRRNTYHKISPGFMHATESGCGNDVAQDWHKGTLLDGELVWQQCSSDNLRLSFLVFDCLAVNGKSVVKHDYAKRRKLLERHFFRPWRAHMQSRPLDMQPQAFEILLKNLQPPRQIEELLKSIIPNQLHHSDGIIFTSRGSPYRFGTNRSVLKWKQPNDITVDFMVKTGAARSNKRNQRYNLFVYTGRGSHEYFAPLSLENGELEQMKKECWDGRSQVLECFRNVQTGLWRPKLRMDGTFSFRHDKLHANHIKVVKDILRALEDAVTEQELLEGVVKPRALAREARQ